MSKVIVIDPGHSGWDPGAIAIDGRPEKDYTLHLSLAVRDQLLKRFDCTVLMTRETDVALAPPGQLAADLNARAMVANQAGADLFMSNHHDAGGPEARGASLYIHTNKRAKDGGLAWLPAIAEDGRVNHEAPNSFRLAQTFLPPVKEELARYGIPWRDFGGPTGIACADFQVLRDAFGPCMLLETHFGTNEHDNWAARRPGFIVDLATAIATGIGGALSLPHRSDEAPNWEARALAAEAKLKQIRKVLG